MLKQVLIFTMEPETTKYEMLCQWLAQLQCEFTIGIDLAVLGRIISHVFLLAIKDAQKNVIFAKSQEVSATNKSWM